MNFFRSANCLVNDMQRANRWAECQWTCFGYSSSREPPIEPKFFLELLTSYTHVFNTEARIFDHFLNFPNRATGTYIIKHKTCTTKYSLCLYSNLIKNQLYNHGVREIVSFQLILFHVWCRAINFTCIMMIDNDWLFPIQSDCLYAYVCSLC